MTNNRPGWALELLGEKTDLDDLREFLAPPFDPWVEDYQDGDIAKAVLRCVRWFMFSEAADVVRDARRVIDRLNGELLLIYTDAHSVTLGPVMKFDAQGKREHILFAATGRIDVTMGRVRGRAKGTAGGAAKPAHESPIQKWFREAEADEVRADLFSHLSRADNWFDLYKGAELARRLAGSQSKLKALLGADWKEWDRVWRTANAYRHAPDPVNYPLPKQPPELDHAREIILKIIPRVL